MSDSIDDANDTAELHLTAALASKKPSGPQPMGKCHYCDEPLTDPAARWCDALCRDDWEYEQKFA